MASADNSPDEPRKSHRCCACRSSDGDNGGPSWKQLGAQALGASVAFIVLVLTGGSC